MAAVLGRLRLIKDHWAFLKETIAFWDLPYPCTSLYTESINGTYLMVRGRHFEHFVGALLVMKIILFLRFYTPRSLYRTSSSSLSDRVTVHVSLSTKDDLWSLSGITNAPFKLMCLFCVNSPIGFCFTHEICTRYCGTLVLAIHFTTFSKLSPQDVIYYYTRRLDIQWPCSSHII